MERFCFSKYIFSITPKTTLFLPSYHGSPLRGGFGHAFRRIICAFKGRECTDCLLRQQCVYAYVFETPIPADAQICGKYLLTERANEGYIVIFDPKTTVGELCTPQERLVQGKKY